MPGFYESGRRALSIRAVVRLRSELMSLSQTRMTCHPASLSLARTRLSRATFDWIFRTQYSLLCPSESLATRFARFRPCQKSPSANTTTLFRSNTRSGQPGNDDTFVLNLSPYLRMARQSFCSHLVPRFRLALAAMRLAFLEAGRSPVKGIEYCFCPCENVIVHQVPVGRRI
jgi:hypothetical protein